MNLIVIIFNLRSPKYYPCPPGINIKILNEIFLSIFFVLNPRMRLAPTALGLYIPCDYNTYQTQGYVSSKGLLYSCSDFRSLKLSPAPPFFLLPTDALMGKRKMAEAVKEPPCLPLESESSLMGGFAGS